MKQIKTNQTTETMTHTTDKWIYSYSGLKDDPSSITILSNNCNNLEGRNEVICEIPITGFGDKRALANAKLMAAAPELLQVCQLAMKSDIDGSYVTGSKWWGKMEEAIKKATE